MCTNSEDRHIIARNNVYPGLGSRTAARGGPAHRRLAAIRAAALRQRRHLRQLCVERGEIAGGASNDVRSGLRERARVRVVAGHVTHIDEHVVDDLVRRRRLPCALRLG